MAPTHPPPLNPKNIPLAILSISTTLFILQHRNYTNTGGIQILLESLILYTVLHRSLTQAIQILHPSLLTHLSQALLAHQKASISPIGRYPSSSSSNTPTSTNEDSLSCQPEAPPSLISTEDIHPLDSRSNISSPANPLEVLTNTFQPIEDTSHKYTCSYMSMNTRTKVSSDGIMAWMRSFDVPDTRTPNLLSGTNLRILEAVSEGEYGGSGDGIERWNLEVVEARPEGMWLANRHEYDEQFGPGGSWEGYGYRADEEGYRSGKAGKKDRGVLGKKKPDGRVEGGAWKRNVLRKREGRRWV